MLLPSKVTSSIPGFLGTPLAPREGGLDDDLRGSELALVGPAFISALTQGLLRITLWLT
jgi:hypothetical protein